MTPANEKLLQDGAAQLGISAGIEMLRLFDIYLGELLRWNKKLNLTAITDESEVVVKHFLDSLAFSTGFDGSRPLRLLDIGAGAGFPGIPLRLAYPLLDITLIDSVGKKVAFMNHVCRTLGIFGVRAFHGRAEELGMQTDYHGRFDVVTLRAVADPQKAADLAGPFLGVDGRIVLSRGAEEMSVFSASALTGFRVLEQRELTLPGTGIRRTIMVLEKV